ncbi:hypothetical protein [Ferruginibacter albus]|uniref:hypothetical protein n=1 Tax=Ferruginibacter albus TaxID=2875540 RepID=UPI001CC49008|nr:hypothetical protein [Ferruginibacter albus]UAY53366.1 hypothetical protein K9M53_06760 [Ferruginibacter albus]
MKIILSILAGTIILLSCSKSNFNSPALGTITTNVDGVPVTSFNGTGVFGGSITTGFNISSDLFYIKGLSSVPTTNVSYPVFITYLQTQNQDTTIYKTITDTASAVFTSIDGSSGIVRGTFSGTVADSSAIPITHVITNGQFYLKVEFTP